MEFDSSQSIYLQISDYVCENVLVRRWHEGDRIPSVRELAVEIEVNPNTVVRAYGHLQESGIIQNKRGLGYFVAEGALETARKMKTEEFVRTDLPRLFRTMDLLDMSFEQLQRYYDEYKEQ
jgi:DNA-binding transcriptional regulator YhcF (GntR family)